MRLLRFLIFGVLLGLSAWAQQQQPLPEDQKKAHDGNRRYALELFEQNKQAEALPLLEELHLQDAVDFAVTERLATCLINLSASLQDPQRQKLQRQRARKLLLEAKAAGDSSNYLNIALDIVPEGGGENASFSDKKAVDDAMHEGEAAFGSGDFDRAIKAYTRAIIMDPNNYWAALFLGDCYFRKDLPGSAGVWFAKAIQIDPNTETAYRYWGDALMKDGKMQEARGKFIQAFITAPYSRTARVGLVRWAEQAKVTLAHPEIHSSNRMDPGNKPGDLVLTIDKKSMDAKDGSSAWMVYELTRANWKNQEFKKRFPTEKEYRHTLAEETEALATVASVAIETAGKKLKGLNPALSILIKLKKEELIEAYVLLATPDQGIAQDYPEYYKEHRQKLVDYMEDYVVPKFSPVE